MEAKLEQQLKDYYEEIFTVIRDCRELLIFGPAEAKTEFEKFIKQKSGFNAVVSVATYGKLTENQIIATVKNYFED